MTLLTAYRLLVIAAIVCFVLALVVEARRLVRGLDRRRVADRRAALARARPGDPMTPDQNHNDASSHTCNAASGTERQSPLQSPNGTNERTISDTTSAAVFGDGPRLLVLFSGGQGASEGYRRAGFRTVDVDIDPDLHPPTGHSYVVGDALDAMRCLLAGDSAYEIEDFAAIHASPPCQRWTRAQNARKNADAHPDLITPLRPLLIAAGLPYVIENVPGAPLIDPVSLCGTSFGLRHDGFELRRERLFETNWGLAGLQCAHDLPAARVFGHGPDAWFYRRYGRGYSYADQRALMETPWAHWDEIGDMIPPAFTEYIGRQLLAYLDAEEEAAA